MIVGGHHPVVLASHDASIAALALMACAKKEAEVAAPAADAGAAVVVISDHLLGSNPYATALLAGALIVKARPFSSLMLARV